MAASVLRSSKERDNFLRFARLLIAGGTVLLRGVFDMKCPPRNLPTILQDPYTEELLEGAGLSKEEWKCLYPSSRKYGKSIDFDITLLFRLLRTICGLTRPKTGWSALPASTDDSLEADLARIKYYRNKICHTNEYMKISDDEFSVLWREISETLVRVAGKISRKKAKEWKDAIRKFLKDPLTEKDERYRLELRRWYQNDKEVIEHLRDLDKEVKLVKKEIKLVKEKVGKEARRIRRKQKSGAKRIKKCFRQGLQGTTHRSELVGRPNSSAGGAAPCDSTEKAQRNTEEVWTATEKAPNASLKRRRTDGNEQTKSVLGKAPNTSLKRRRTDGNEQTKSAQEKSPNTSLKRKRTDGNEQAKSVQGGTSVSEDNEELNQLHSAERDSDVTKMKSTPPLERSVDSRNARGITPLMNAAMNGNVQAVELLIWKGADPSFKDNLGWNSLHFAALRGDTAIISLIHTQMQDTESLNGEGATPLLVAAYNGKLHAVKWFLERGANAAYEDNGGWNALHSAASSGDPETIDHILTHVPNIESKTADGETPLIIAVRCQTLQGVKCLLERGADPLATDNEGQDSLYYASSGDPILLDLVLNHVANSESTTGND